MALIDTLTVQSNVSPPLVINAPLSGGGGGASGLSGMLLRILRPEITITGDLGTHTITPYGKPSPMVFPALILAVLVGVVIWRS